MLNTITEFQVANGAVLETYSVERDETGDIFIRNVLDAEMGGPVDTLHVDEAAAVRIARALLIAVGCSPSVRVDIPPPANVVAFRWVPVVGRV